MGSISRREGLLLLSGAAMATDVARAGSVDQYARESEAEATRSFENVHRGNGLIGITFFRFGGAPAPAAFLTYDIPPGASEGVHVHRLDDEKRGSFDEYYYIVSGTGQMEIDGAIVPVRAGDHIHTPLDVWHGIENISDSQPLKVFLTFIRR